MIKAVWGLKLGNQILGVRLQTKNDQYYDIDIDVYKKQLGLNPSFLTSIPLFEYGDMLMTENEFNTGQIIEDGSQNQSILQSLKGFMATGKATDITQTAKFQKAKQDLKQKYYTYLPNDWLEEFATYHLLNFDGNANIYESLTSSQIGVVKEYFRWRSRLIFDEKKASRILRTKPQKTEKLVALMGNAEDWEYDGTVDTGYRGGGFCELGHALRYEHYAVSPTARKHIIFGKTCMSDFFQVDDKVLSQIVAAQEILLKELKSIVFVINTDKKLAYSTQYVELENVTKALKANPPKNVRNLEGWLNFFSKFQKVGLPLTRSMVNKYIDLLRGVKEAEKAQAKNNEFEKAIQIVRDLGYSEDVINGVMYEKYNTFLARYLKLSILKGDIPSYFVSNGLGIVADLHTIQNKMTTVLDSIPMLLTNIEKKYHITKYGEDRRLATVNEIKYAKYLTRKGTYLNSTKTKELELLLRQLKIVPSLERFPPLVRSKHQDFIDNFSHNLLALTAATGWGMQDSFLNDIKPFFGTIEQPEFAPDEDFEEDNINHQYDFILKHKGKMTELESNRFFRIKNHDLAHTNEIEFIYNVYYRVKKRLGLPSNPIRVTDEPTEPPKPADTLDSILNEELDRLIEAMSAGEIPETNFVFKIIPTIRKTGKISEKQRKYVDSALALLNKKD